MIRYHFHVHFRPEPEGGYTAIIPSLPGCITYGKSIEEASKMAEDAIQGYLESVRKSKEKIRDDQHTLIMTQEVSYA